MQEQEGLLLLGTQKGKKGQKWEEDRSSLQENRGTRLPLGRAESLCHVSEVQVCLVTLTWT